MRVKTAAFFLAVLLSATSSPAQAFDKQAAKQMLSSVAQADANKDGKTTLAEFRAMRAAQFKRYKAKDGNLDLAAFAKTSDARKKLLSELDDNKDEKISQPEYVNHKPKAWGRIDRDGDGALSSAEIKNAKARMG
jgi:Ca2+-binding EF-hand superfamily protein